MYVHPKKALGQHFLKDLSTARRIVEALSTTEIPLPNGLKEPLPVLELGPGTGVLTQFLVEQPQIELCAVEIDREAVDYLLTHFPALNGRLVQGDFLNMDLSLLFTTPFWLIGNFPYNISSQIFFKILEEPDRIPVVVCMLQKEVAERIAAPPGSKTYGILSVLLQTWYHIEYLFTVPEQVFVPPPKVKSAVIRLIRNDRKTLACPQE
ncbi:MAG: 16S rRNA (adenine(1518)-N(6)/adenine(1519)-N(6))-dimethyltransferase RsmA, partial [Bacteroidetes bacterium]|nr:16S rRNA (adenine(1518)-N(6)/adenine(1519)-N(6))-dimethyltransferase RsmA [Bacteroidota bacterium]